MIAIYQRTASGVVRADTATTVAESHASLRRIGPPAVAYDGSVFVAAAGGTSASDLRAITAVATAGAEHEARSCAWPGCCAAVARVREMTSIGLVGFCGAHRRLIYECSRPVDTDDPDAVARLVERVGPPHCSKDRCPWCRADLRRAVAELTRRAA